MDKKEYQKRLVLFEVKDNDDYESIPYTNYFIYNGVEYYFDEDHIPEIAGCIIDCDDKYDCDLGYYEIEYTFNADKFYDSFWVIYYDEANSILICQNKEV